VNCVSTTFPAAVTTADATNPVNRISVNSTRRAFSGSDTGDTRHTGYCVHARNSWNVRVRAAASNAGSGSGLCTMLACVGSKSPNRLTSSTA